MNFRKNSGITLIALVITIIVLLILAGVSLSLIVGSDGIMDKAEKAATKTNIESIKEEVGLAVTDLKLKYYKDKYTPPKYENRTFLKYLSDEFESYETTSGSTITCTETGELTYTDKNNFETYFEVTEEGEVEYLGNSNGPVEDTQPPSITIIKTTTSSIEFKATDKYGVVAYAVTETQTEPTEWIEIESTKEYVGEIIEKVSNKTYYLWAKDNAGNISLATEAQTIDFEPFSYEVKSWNGTKALIEVKTPSQGVKYKIGASGSWTDYSENTKLEVESGTIVYFQVTDGTNEKDYDAVTPLWTGIVSYDANGGSGTVPISQEVEHTKTVDVNFAKIPTKEKCTFLGWATSSSATTPTYTQDGTKTFVMGTDNVILYAVWESSSIAEKITPDNYGDSVNYSVTVNGVELNNWKIFYNDGETVTMIYGDYLPNTTNLATGAGLSQATTSGYKIYSVYSNVSAADFVTKLDDSSRWSKLIKSDFEGRAFAKGAPDIDMWVASWNDNGYKKLYTNNNPSAFLIGESPTELPGNVSLKDDEGYKNKLYFPYTEEFYNCNGYRLASSLASSTIRVATVCWNRKCFNCSI